MLDRIMYLLNKLDDFMYYPVLLIVLAAGGLYFTFRTKCVQLRMLGHSCKLTMINIPCCLMLSGQAFAALKDYEKQRKAGKVPVFKASDIGLDSEQLSCWK